MRHIKKLTVAGVTAFTMATMIPMTSQAADIDSICNSLEQNKVVLSQENCKLEEVSGELEQIAIKGNQFQWGIINNCENNGTNGSINIGQGGGTNGGQTERPEKPESPELPETEGETTESSYAKQILSLVNAERAKEGLASLTWNSQSAKAGMVRANEIQTNFSHTRPDGSSFSTVLKEHGVSYRGAGENIAWGQKTPEEVMKAWMNSPGHRANIMNKNFTSLGVGYVQNANGTPYWVQLFTS